jgi:urease accessory protein
VTVAIAGVGRQGRLDIAFAQRVGRTVIRDSYCEVPFKITRLLDSDVPGYAHLILMQCTAGLFGGDEIESSIHVDAGARVLLTQQSATKIHPSSYPASHPASDLPAIQRTRIVVESGAELIVDFEPVIPFADSQFHQSTHIDVAPGGSLVFWEGMMAGRIGRNERWQFRELRSETRVDSAGRPLILERYHLNPSRENPESPWIMNSASYVGTGVCFKEGAAQRAERLHEAMPDAGVDILGPDLVSVRVATASGPDFHRYREAFRILTNPS